MSYAQLRAGRHKEASELEQSTDSDEIATIERSLDFTDGLNSIIGHSGIRRSNLLS